MKGDFNPLIDYLVFLLFFFPLTKELVSEQMEKVYDFLQDDRRQKLAMSKLAA